ncbi:MAG: extracellular solute-binding protein [Treponema sp.]|jgi:putative aldouronate transport system substrate-binding protein|nr:extracellular solute-binding protein [Treponema sp.]
MKKIVIVKNVAAVLLLAALCGGCAKKDVPAQSPAQAGGGSDGSSRDPITMSYYFPMHPSDVAEHFNDQAPGLVKLKEKTGVSIKWQLIPGNLQLQTEQFNLMMGSGEITDVVCSDIAARLKLYPDAWLPLDDLIKGNPQRYPNLNKYIYQDSYLMKYLPDSDGKNRYIPMIATRRIGNVFIVREDLLNKYGLNSPVTLEDWHTVLTAAKADGKIPYMTRSQRAGIMALFEGFMDCVREDYFVENGVVKYGVFDPRLKEAVEIARQWYAEGLIDKEYPSTDSTVWWESVLRGDVFATIDNIQRLAAANFEFMNQNSEIFMTGLGPMESPKTGKRHTTGHYPKVRDKSAAISRSAKNPERILDYFEYCYSEEGFILMNFGIENVSFEYVDGVPRLDPNYTKAVADKVKPHVITVKDQPKIQKNELDYDYNLDRPDHNSLRKIRDEYRANDYIQENWIASLSFTDAERSIITPIRSEIDTYRSEMLDKFIMGIEPMSNWDAFVSQIQRMNLQKTIDIYQAALDRLLK